MADKEKERGRFIQIDGSDTQPFIINKDKLLIGRGDACNCDSCGDICNCDSCEIRIKVEGVAHEHCILTFDEDGQGFMEPVNKCSFTFLNGDLIERQVSLEHNDVVTLVNCSFRFYYPSSSKFYVPSVSPLSFESNKMLIVELSEYPIMKFLSGILDLSSLKKGSSSILDNNDNILYILENLVFKMKMTSQFQSTVAACAKLKESEMLKPDSFDYFVPKSCANINVEVYCTDENIKMTRKLVCGLISAFKMLIRIYDEKNGIGPFALSSRKKKILMMEAHSSTATQSSTKSKVSQNEGFSDIGELVYKFTKHALRALDVFSNQDLDHFFTKESLNNEGIAVKNLALIYIIGPLYRSEKIFENILPVIFECMEKNSLVKDFTNFLLGHCRTSKRFSLTLLEHFSCETSLEVLAYDKISSKKVNMMLSLFADVLQSFNLFPNDIGEFHLKYLGAIVKNCIKLTAVASCSKTFLWILKTIYLAVFHDKDKKPSCCDYLCRLLSCVFQAFDVWLRNPVENKTWCLILETILSISKSVAKKSAVILLPFVDIICKCLIFSLKENSEIALKALNVFDILLENMTLDHINSSISPIKSELLDALYTSMKRPEDDINDKTFEILGKMGCYNRDNFTELPKLQETESSSCLLLLHFEDHTKRLSQSHLPLPLTKFPIDVAHKIITSSNESVEKKKLSWTFIKELLKIHAESSKISFNSPNAAVGDSKLCIIHKKALVTMFAATDVECLCDDAKIFQDNLIKSYVTFTCKKKNLFLTIIDAAFEAICAVVTDKKENVNISSLTSILSVITSERYKNEYTYISFEHVVESAIEFCYKENWEAKVAGCKTISYILEITDIQWKAYNMYKFFKPLLYNFADSNEKLSFGTSKEAINLLEDMMMLVNKYTTTCNSAIMNQFYYNISGTLIEELVSPDYYIRKQVRGFLNELVHAFDKKLQDVVIFKSGNLYESVYVAHLYENFDFGCSLLPLTTIMSNSSNNKQHDKLYDDLKSLCNNLSYLNYSDASNSVNTENVYQYCGALNALCFNFVHKISIRELFGIYVATLRSPMREVSETSAKCLKYIVNKHRELRDAIIELAADWASNLHSLLAEPSLLDKYKLEELLYFQQIFPYWRKQDFLIPVLRIFVIFKATLFALFKLKKQNYCAIYTLSEKISVLIEIINTVKNLRDGVVKEVLSFVIKLQPYQKVISTSCLKNSLLNFCRLHYLEALFALSKHRRASFLFKELVKFQNDTYQENIFEVSFLKRLNLRQIFHILNFTTRYAPWLFKKNVALLKFLVDFYKRRLDIYMSSRSKSSINTFLFGKKCKILVKCFIYVFMNTPENVDILFELMKIFTSPFSCNFQNLKDYILNTVAKEFPTSWLENCFRRFWWLLEKNILHPVAAEILEFIFIPSFHHAIRKGKWKNFVHINGESISVLGVFFKLMRNVYHHSRKVTNMIVELAILFAEQLHVMSYEKLILDECRGFAKSLLQRFRCNSYGWLLFLIIQDKTFINQESVVNPSKYRFYVVSFAYIMELSEKDLIMEKVLYICAKRLPPYFLSKICEQIVTHYHTSLDKMLNVVFACKEEFHHAAHIFLRYYMTKLDKATVSKFQQFQQIDKIIGLIDVITIKKFTDREFTREEITWIVNVLLIFLLFSKERDSKFKNCLKSRSIFFKLNSQEISDKCHLLLKRILEGNVSFEGYISFEAWLVYHFIDIIEQPELYQECEIFKFMAEALDYMPRFVILFVKRLHECFGFFVDVAEVTSSHIKILEHISKFLLKLTEKYSPNSDVLPEELDLFYAYLKQMSIMTDYITISKAIVLEALGAEFYWIEFRDFIVSHVKKMFDHYLEKFDTLLGSKSVIVWLQITQKIFLEINEKDKRTLLSVFLQVIDMISHSEIILQMVNVTKQFVSYLKRRKNVSQPPLRKKRKKSVSQDVYDVFVLLAKISSKVDSHFAYDEEINVKLFKVLMIFRKEYGSLLLQDHSFKSENLELPSTRIDEHLISQFKSRLLYMPVTFYHAESRQIFFQHLGEEMQIDVFGIIKFIFGNKFNFTVPKFYIPYCTNLISMLVKKVIVIPDSNCDHQFEAPDILSSVVQLCYEDAFLAENIWMCLFPAVCKILGEENTKIILHNKDAIAHLEKISSKECMFPNPFDVFINAAVKVSPELCLYVNEKCIQRSFSFQVFGSQVLENLLLSENYSSENYDAYVKIVNDIYTHLEESDVYYCFNQSYARHTPPTVLAMSSFQDNDICESHNYFKTLLTYITSDDFVEFSQSERKFCENEFIKCCKEISKWNFFSQIGNSTNLTDIQIFSKWNIQIQDQSTTLSLQSNFSKCPVQDCSFKEKVLIKCLKTWKSLPRFFNQRLYSLLELTQEITELAEAWRVQYNCKLPYKHETSKTIEDIYYKWRERSYLPSDGYHFLTELFHIRLAFLKYFNAKCSPTEKDIFVDDASISASKYISTFTKHEMNESLIELCSVALNFKNLHMKNLEFDKYSYENAFSLLQMKLLSLLRAIGQSSSQIVAIKENIKEKATCILKNGFHLHPSKCEEINFDVQYIYQKLGLDIELIDNSDHSSFQGNNVKFYEVIYDKLERKFASRNDMIIAAFMMQCLLRSCRYGDILDSFKIIPKIFQILKLDDDDRLLPEVLQEYIIPVHYWLPFLPFLINCLLHSLSKEDDYSLMDVEADEKPSLSFVLSNIFVEIGKAFPQEVFLSVYSLKEMEPSCERSKESEGICPEYIPLYKKKFDEIIASLKTIYPCFLSKLEGIMKDLKMFSPTEHERKLSNLKKLLEEVYSSLYTDFNNGNTRNCSEEFTSYLKEELKPYFNTSDSSSMATLYHINGLSSEIGTETCSYASVFDILVKLIKKYRILLNNKKKNFFLGENRYLISKLHLLDEEIYMFGESPLVDNSSQVKIVKFLPKVDVQKWSDHLSYKISILGHNGKVYPFLSKEGLFLTDILKRMSCILVLDNLNIMLKNNVKWAKRFFNFYFPRILSVNANLIFVPHCDGMFLYQDIYKHTASFKGGSYHEHVTNLLLEFPHVFENSSKIMNLFKMIQAGLSEDTLKQWVENFYKCPMELFFFKKQFTKHISMLIAIEYFLNISVTNELLVYKNSGSVSVLHPEFNLHNIQKFSLLLTPNICHFIGPLGMKLVAENVYQIASCFKENINFFEIYLDLLEMDELEDIDERIIHFSELMMTRLHGMNREKILNFVEQSTSADIFYLVNPMIRPFF